MTTSRSKVVSSFTIIKGSLIDETYSVFRDWDSASNKYENLRRVRDENTIGATSAHWARDVSKVLNRRFEPSSRDRTLVDLARAGCAHEVWDPLLLFHMTRDEYLLRDFLIHWLYPNFTQGVFRIQTSDVVEYLATLSKQKDIEWSGKWTESTTERVASGLLRIAVDFGLLSGTTYREFSSFHLPEESFMYILYALRDAGLSARQLLDAEEWKMFLLDEQGVDRELLRLHQFNRVHYQVAGSVVELKLPHADLSSFVKELAA